MFKKKTDDLNRYINEILKEITEIKSVCKIVHIHEYEKVSMNMFD